MVLVSPPTTSPLLVSTVSVAILLLASSVTIYFYSSYARPETVSPEYYEQEIISRIGNIDKALSSLKKSYKWNRFYTAPDSSNLAAQTIMEAEPVLPKNPVSNYFEGLDEQAEAVAATEIRQDGIKEEDKQIETIEFLPRSTRLEQEIKEDDGEVVDEATDKVIIKQVGLSLGTRTIHASVHRIQNLFGNAGLNGHLYILEARISDWDRESLENVMSLNFSSKENLVKSLQSKGLFISTLIFPDKKNQYIYINGPSFSEEFIKYAIEPVEKQYRSGPKDFINPYKWLYLSTKYPVKRPLIYGKPIIALVYPYKDGDEVVHERKMVTYPEDINLFPVESLSKWDISIHEAVEQRIVNHSLKMLTQDEIDDLDKIK